jgi:hypothetical protein
LRNIDLRKNLGFEKCCYCVFRRQRQEQNDVAFTIQMIQIAHRAFAFFFVACGSARISAGLNPLSKVHPRVRVRIRVNVAVSVSSVGSVSVNVSVNVSVSASVSG